jgi:hypothetical protein
MVNEANFPNAYKEVYTVLKYVDEKDVNLISKDFLKLIETKMNKDYEFEYDINTDFENQKLLRETRVIFTYIFVNFWATEEQKKLINLKFKQDIKKEEELKEEKYNCDNIFEKEEKTKKNSSYNIQNTGFMVKYKEPIWKKIYNKIIMKFKKNS